MKQCMAVCAMMLLLSVSVTGVASDRPQPDYLDSSLDFESRAADLVARLTLEEKISQLGNVAPGIERLGIAPYDWWNECLHGVARAGVATVFPQAIGLAASFDRAMMHDTAIVISDEARAKHHEYARNKDFGRYKGLTFWSPNINIFRDPRWGRGHETYGEDPYLTGQMGIQFVRGLQGDDPKYFKVIATAKHFAVHSGPESQRHHFNAVVGARDLWETYLPAFRDLIAEGKAYSVMGAYNRVDGESASASWMLLRDILREQWKFDGYVVSDCGAIDDIFNNHKIVDSAQAAAAIGVRRGCDLDCGKVYQKSLIDAVQKGMLDEAEIDLAVYRLFLARMKLGMFDPPQMVKYAQIPYSVNNSTEHNEMALKVAQKTMTLLKNNGVLPLDKREIKTIAVIGPNADSVPALLGNYNGTPSTPVTVLEGIRRAVGDKVQVLYSKGCRLAEGVGQAAMPAVGSRYLLTTDEAGQPVHGLTGAYYRGTALEGEPVLTRIDSQIEMEWLRSSPTTTAIAQGTLGKDQRIDDDNFSIRWTGQLVAPVSGPYKLGLTCDDGGRLYLNGKKIVDGWSEHSMQTFTADVTLQEGKRYDIVIEYYDATLEAGIHFVWLQPQSEELADRKMIEDVSKADVAIFVGGLDAGIEGEEMSIKAEGFDRGDRTRIELPAVQKKLIQELHATGTPVVFVLLAGSSIADAWVMENIPAVLMGWYPGRRGGEAVASVLFGEYNPAGRLPVTFYASTDELGDFSNYVMAAGRGKTYRYYKGEPLYPFGYGLSYTTFEYANLKISPAKISKDKPITVKCTIKNTGSRDGEEVIQLYVRDVKSDKPMPIKQLRDFERIALKAGEQKTVTFKLTPSEDFRYYDPQLQRYAVEPGDFEIQLGSSSADIRLSGTVAVQKAI